VPDALVVPAVEVLVGSTVFPGKPVAPLPEAVEFDPGTVAKVVAVDAVELLLSDAAAGRVVWTASVEEVPVACTLPLVYWAALGLLADVEMERDSAER